MDPNGKTFLQDVVLEWRPQYCDKYQKLGHVCQVEVVSKEEATKKRRPWKKLTQIWKYKGPISQKNDQEKQGEHRQEKSPSPKLNKQKEEQEEEQITQQELEQKTPKNNEVQEYRQLELSLANFPILKPIPTRNGFESLMHTKKASLSIDRGGEIKTC